MQTKRILGLDLGSGSIGWSLVTESRDTNKKLIDAEIIKLGVRVNPLTVDEKKDFEKGRPLSTNSDRTLKRGIRRNLQRYKLRREDLITILIKHKFITKETPLTEIGKGTTHQTLRMRARSANHRVDLEELAKIFLAINKKRGYKSSRKTKDNGDGLAIDGMEVAKILYDNQLTPGQFALQLLEQGKKYIPDFYRSDLQAEFDQLWENQKQFYPDLLSNDLYDELQNKASRATWAICQKAFQIEGIKLEGKQDQQKKKKYELRVDGLSKQLNLEHLAIALQEINNKLNNSSGYLGKISDRSKVLYMNNKTVGEYLYEQIEKNPHTSLKNQVFYRQDYLDEFERIWETQAKFHPELKTELKEEIRDVIIFYQRKLKSQKSLLSFCLFESWEEDRKDKNGNLVLNKSTGFPKHRTVGHRVIPRSSPLFQEFKIWQNINNLQLKRIDGNAKDLFNQDSKEVFVLEDEDRQLLFTELNLRGNLNEKQILKLLNLSSKEWKTNFSKGLEGNRTNQKLYNVYQTIADNEGYGFDWAIKSAKEIKEELKAIFPSIGINPEILDFNANADGESFDKQASYQLWHLLYSAEDDQKVSEEDRQVYGNSAVSLKKKLVEKYGFKIEYARLLAGISLEDDYGNLSARAIRKIIPHLQDGNSYSEACTLAGYNHSRSYTREELDHRILKNKLEILPKNSLRNPVVEKILNQMVNLVNQLCDEYGKPDEVRIELARELKKSAAERQETTRYITTATKVNDDIRKTIEKDFGFKPTKNDVVRYKLWLELSHNGHKTLFTDTYIPREKLFSKEVDIEHIIPKAMLFDDSFSNKTLAIREVNLKKANRTAMDFISSDYIADSENYVARVDSAHKAGAISKGKYKKLLMTADNLPEGFIERDLRNSQYIAKKAKEMLFEVFNDVVSTSGNITDKLRSDWDLINVMKELNLPKYKKLGLTKMEKRWDSGQEKTKTVEVIQDWTKRNDHRHHAMDALTVAFTSHNHIQYINNLNARKNQNHKKHSNIIAIEKLITDFYPVGKNGRQKRKFIPPTNDFRKKAKRHIEEVLVSFKTKNKVVTRNINRTQIKNGYQTNIQLTPRGQLHKETVYGKAKRPMNKPTKLNKKFSTNLAKLIIDQSQRALVLNHLAKYNHESSIAFDSKLLKKEPILWHGEPLKEVLCYEEIFTIRKEINPDNFKNDKLIDKIVDKGIREVMKNRLKEFGGKPKEAFSNLDQNPIWLNKDKGISIKRITITGVSNAEPLHHKKDHLGQPILDENGKTQAVDFVSTGNNHHLAVYSDKQGKYHDKIVSFYEAVARVNAGLPIIDKSYNTGEGWQFLFTLKQNEMFVFPSEEFNPLEIDLMDEKNAKLISKHLFRVQKISKVPVANSFVREFVFRHHLETTVSEKKALKDIAFKNIKSLGHLEGIVKVRINHIGKIVTIGEY